MVDLAAKYLARPAHQRTSSVERFIPVPWKWFDPTFNQGFRGCYRWFRKWEKKHKEWRPRAALLRVEEAYLANERLPEAFATNSPHVRRRQKLPATTMYQKGLAALARYNRPDLIAEFNAFVFDATTMARMPQFNGL